MSYHHLRRFLEKVKAIEPGKSREFVMTVPEALGLNNDITKLLTDLHELSEQTPRSGNIQKIEVSGGDF